MKRRRRWLLAVLSVMLLIATVVLWVRSRRLTSSASDWDSFDFTHSEPLYWVISNRDRLTLCRQVGHDWQSPQPRFNVLGLEYASSWVGSSSLWNFLIPFWMLAVVFALLPVIRLIGWIRSRPVISGKCTRCSYDLTGNVSGICPECGTLVKGNAPIRVE